MKRFIGDRKFYKSLLLVALPIALQMLFSSLVNIIDNVMVANWGGIEAVNAVTYANRYFLSFNKILMMFAVAAGVFIAQYNGAKDYMRLKRSFGCAIIFCSVLGLVAFAFGFIKSDMIIHFFVNTDNEQSAEVMKMARSYLQIISFSLLMQALTLSFTMAFRPIKMTIYPLLASIAAMLINIVLNTVFIYILDQGVAGAAVATLIARGGELLVLVIIYFVKKPVFYGSIKDILYIPRRHLLLILKKSLPLCLSQLVTEMILIMMLFYYSHLELEGGAGVAGIQITTYIFEMVMVFVGGLGTASTVLVGSNLGSGNIEEGAKNARWLMSFAGAFSLLSMLAMFLIIPLTPYIYGTLSEDELSILRLMIMIQALATPFAILANNYIFIIRCGGKTMIAFFVNNIIGFINFLIITFLIYGLPHFIMREKLDSFYKVFDQAKGIIIFIYIIEKCAETVRFVIGFIVYKRKKWLNNLTLLDS